MGRTRLGFIETAGNLCQNIGIPRSTGQIFGLLYLSPKALSLDDIAVQLSVSKASASAGSRQLLGWQAIRQVWVPGDRRDFFEARGELADVLRAAYENVFRAKVEKSDRKIRELLANLEAEHASGGMKDEEYELCRSRLRQFEKIQDRLRLLTPFLEKLL